MHIGRYVYRTPDSIDTEDVRLLAEMVAAGETDRALELIDRLFPETVSVTFLKKNAEWRSGEVQF